MPPVIGICAAVEQARWSHWDQEAALVPLAYVDAVQLAGGLALIIPPDDEAAEKPDELLDKLDGLILIGGADVDPATYGATPGPHTGATRPERDRFELALAYGAMERGRPRLGLCRGGPKGHVACGGRPRTIWEASG